MVSTVAKGVATLGGGCFWCLEAVYEQVRGVENVESGYAGGHVKNPTYEQVCSGTTGHAEVVQVTFDPKALTYEELLRIFFTIHDPTTKNRQGNDTGPQYRSIILYHTSQQKATAEAVLREIDQTKLYRTPIVTELVAADTFYPAEAYHRQYYRRNPDQSYCQFVIDPKVAKFRAKWANKLRAG